MAHTPPSALLQEFFARVDEVLGIPLTAPQQEHFAVYFHELMRWNRAYNLVGRSNTTEDILTRHFLDCLAAWKQVRSFQRLADLGSGAGMPGLVFAIMSQDEQELTLVEPHEKKWLFLDEMARNLGIAHRVKAARQRDVELNPEVPFDWVCSRAYASLDYLMAISHPLLTPGGHLLVFKGEGYAQELAVSTPSPLWTAPTIVPNPLSSGVFIILAKVSRET